MKFIVMSITSFIATVGGLLCLCSKYLESRVINFPIRSGHLMIFVSVGYLNDALQLRTVVHAIQIIVAFDRARK